MNNMGQQYDHDARHFAFDRNSRLPDNYWREPRVVDAIVVAVVLALGAVTVGLWMAGIIT